VLFWTLGCQGNNLFFKQPHIYHYDMFPILWWVCFKLGHFCNTLPIFFYLQHFTFFLHHLVLMVRNIFSHTLICMFDKIVQTFILVLHSNKKTCFDSQKCKIQTLKENNTFVRVFYKHHRLNYFGSSHQRGIVHAQNYYSMHTCNTFLRVYKKSFGFHSIYIET
jgi:hypothetical protein